MDLVKVDLSGAIPRFFLLVKQESFDRTKIREILLDFARCSKRSYLVLILFPLESTSPDDVTKIEVIFQQIDKPHPEPMMFYIDNKLDIPAMMSSNCYIMAITFYQNNIRINTNRLLITRKNSLVPMPVVPIRTNNPNEQTVSSQVVNPADLLKTPFNLGNAVKLMLGRSTSTISSIPVQLPSPDVVMGADVDVSNTIVGCYIGYAVNGNNVTTMILATTEMIFKVGDEFTIFMVVKSGSRSALETYSLIIFKQPGCRSEMIGPAIQAHVIKVEYFSKSSQSISLFHQESKRHRKLFSFCVRKPSTRMTQPPLMDYMVKKPII